ncbi:hypothetical protein Nepgr_002335 [Nepenthes gracilis]|uniref:WRC domain-containing protein n=1 Tax=Nepenthes gracilis TaxID=150966 RepID=A0AAD3P6N2_NEPGR|nr:hypothetical protein Nepgr_002335 [Nepenthes gracilis]
MRIRKNAKLSASIVFGSSSSSIPPGSLQAHMCQLNRSPWDVLSFSPVSSHISYQAGGDDSLGAYGSLGDSIAAADSESMKLSCEYEEKAMFEGAGKRENGAPTVKRENGGGKVVLCNKTDGKGWQCQRAAREGGSLCEHHLAQLRFYHQNQSCFSYPADTASKKPEKASSTVPAVPKKRGRPRKTAVPPTNPNEFYYYSGFGPRWGRKRGGSKDSEKEIRSTANTDDDVDDNNANGNNCAAGGSTHSLSSDIVMEDTEELDYIDDDDEENSGGPDDGEICRKRVRKPIKARSLKSLM